MVDQGSSAKPRSPWSLIAVILICVTPLALAWLLTSGAIEWRPSRQLRHGALVTPPLDLVRVASGVAGRDAAYAEPLRGRWTLMLFARQVCDTGCEKRLETLRRVQLALGKEVVNVQRAVFLAKAEQSVMQVDRVRASFPALVRVAAPRPALAMLMRALKPGAAGAGEPSVAILNPDAAIVMCYGSDFDFAGMISDLKRLLHAGRPH